ncbi:MAG: helicase, partial [Candidatus Adiutrix sp.]|nr:helicase [Candidatus Adiutrix sp.]
PPFGSQKVYDPQYPDLDFSIHNYFLSKSVNSLRDGGVAAFVVSRYFMDAVNNPAREYIAERANFLGAIRLPNTAFKQNALTEVTADIVFLQRTNEPELDPAWLKTGVVLDQDGEEITVNQYFIQNPGQMIGRMVKSENMFRGSADLLPPENFAGFSVEIARRLSALPENIYTPGSEEAIRLAPEKADPNLELCGTLKIGAYFLTSQGQLARRVIDMYDLPPDDLFEPKNNRAGERVAGMIRIRDSLTSLMAMEQRDDFQESELAKFRNALNRQYDGFIQKYGFINSPGNRQAMRDDPEWPLLSSLEREYDPGLSQDAAAKTGQEPRPPFAAKADIFRQRVLGPRTKITRVDTPKEALIVSMNEFGRPDLEFMENLCGHSSDDIIGELAGLIYHNPENLQWELADHYLTGNVKAKLAQAEAAAQKDLRFKANVEALKLVQPPDLEPVDISVQLGSTWVPPEVVADFGRHLLGADAIRGVGYHPALAAWALDFNIFHIDRTAAENTWGTSRYPAHKLIDAILNNTLIQVRDEVGRDPQTNRSIYKVNEEETAAANQKADEIRQAFIDWVWLDQARREHLARLYNDRFNTNVPRKYDGSHLTLPGSSLNITLRPHQKDAIWRGIQDGGAVWDHVVGAGKSLVAVGTVMESRRMGLMKKPMIVVPNHLLAQWRDAFYSLYPQANILVADKADFTRENREKLFAKIATGDWDAVIVAHSSFKKIGLPEHTLQIVLNEQINDLIRAVAEEKKGQGRQFMVKELEKARDRLEAMMDRRADTGKKDKALTFADLGCDALVIDESQSFKNLYINTRLRNVAGLGSLSGSAMAFDLFVKARYLQQKHNGRGLYFATGTPISNTIAEMYTIQRYMSYDVLKEKGLVSFDAWASTFGQVVTGWELDATGVGYKINSRFSKFQNMPELVNMYRTFADVITNRDLAEQNQGKSFTPKVKDGRPFNLVLDRSAQQAEYMGVQRQMLDADNKPVFHPDGRPVMEWPKGSIIERMEHLPKDPRIDNPLKITNDARKAGLDFRLISPAAPDYAESKVNVAAGNIFKTWQAWASDKGTQLVFCDLSTPKMGKAASVPITRLAARDVDPVEEQREEESSLSMDEILAGASKFSVYDDLKAKLIAKGIPETEIRYIHEANTDAQKAKLFEEVNQGRVRVLMGSTAKMGAGTNVQRRLVALHHLDCPWRPSDLSQREGRIIRQGNMFHERDPEGFAVEIVRYATKQTYDARQWQCVEGKAVGIEQFRKGDNLARVIEDVAGEAANAAEMKAAATGNELIFMQVKLASELKKMEGILAAFQRGQHQLERRIATLEQFPEQAAKDIERWKKEIELRDKNTTRDSYFAAGGKIYGEKNRKELLFEMARAMKAAVARPDQPQKAGKYRGFGIHVESISGKGCQFVLEGQAGFYTPMSLTYQAHSDFNIQGFMQRL